MLQQQGSHLKTIDVSRTPLPLAELATSKVADVHVYGGMTMTVVSPIDVSIVVEWSADGVVFIPDVDRVIVHTGGVDAGFYERNVLGAYVNFITTNIDLNSEDVHIQCYAKIRATGNFDNGVNIDNPIVPPQDPVWWERNPTDPNEWTDLIGAQLNACACNITINNQLDPALDLIVGNLHWGEVVNYDFAGKTNLSGRNKSFANMLSSGGQLTLVGPGMRSLAVVASGANDVINTAPSPQDRDVKFCLIGGTTGSEFRNITNSCIFSCRDVLLNCAPSPVAPVTNEWGQNVFSCVNEDSYIGNNAGGAGPGCLTTNSFIARMFNSRVRMNAFHNNYLSGTAVLYDRSLGSNTTEGCCVITDNSRAGSTTESQFLQIGTVANSLNTWHSRFAGGYDFWTDNDSTVGLRILAGTSNVAPICDIRFKQDLNEYTDTAGILERVVACPIVTYHHASLMKNDPVKESGTFRITPTAQDFNCVFHPEDGTREEQIVKQEEDGVEEYTNARTSYLTSELERTGEKKKSDPLTAQQQQTITDTINAELITPECQKIRDKMSMKVLNVEEILSASLLCIKELNKQIELLKNRVALLE